MKLKKLIGYRGTGAAAVALAALTATAALEAPAMAGSARLATNLRSQTLPIYCRTQSDHDNRLSKIFKGIGETADHFEVSDFNATVEGYGWDATLTVRAKVKFLACAEKGRDRYGWNPRERGQDNYNFVALPPTKDSDRHLWHSIGPIDSDGVATVTQPIRDLVYAKDFKRFMHGETLKDVMLFLTILPHGKTELRSSARDPGYWAVVDISP